MKKKYYKQIIEQLEQTLENQVSRHEMIYKRMAKAEEEVIWLRNELNELSKDFLNKHNEDINT